MSKWLSLAGPPSVIGAGNNCTYNLPQVELSQGLTYRMLNIIDLGRTEDELSAAEAKDHVGETATVCGNVVSTRYAASTKGQPTFLNLRQPYPNQIFTIVISGSNRSKFGRPEVDYKEKRVCATGKITEYRGVPEVIANEPAQIAVETGR